MLADLLAHDGVIEEVTLDGPIGFMALHGGIEAGTAELARVAAASTGASLYVVEVPSDLWWHVPSTKFDPAESAGLAGFLGHVDQVVSLHGFGRPHTDATVLLGGGNRALAQRMAGHFRHATAFTVVDDLDAIPPKLRGVHARNPVNLPPDGGVQIEMTADLREGEAFPAVAAVLAAAACGEMHDRCERCA